MTDRLTAGGPWDALAALPPQERSPAPSAGQDYINADDGYPWLTCGLCDEPLKECDGGTTLDDLNQAAAEHRTSSHQTERSPS